MTGYKGPKLAGEQYQENDDVSNSPLAGEQYQSRPSLKEMNKPVPMPEPEGGPPVERPSMKEFLPKGTNTRRPIFK